jgi:DNA-binding CsgD family transcriptional regulator
MKHLLIFVDLLVLLTGIAAVAIAGFVYVKTRYGLLFRYLVYMCCFTLVVFSYLVVLSYVNLNIPDPDFEVLLLIVAVCALSVFLFMFAIPYFAHALISEAPARRRNWIAGVLAVTALVFILLSLRVDFGAETIVQERNVWMYLSLSLFFLTVAYSIVVKVLSLKRLDETRRRVVRNVTILNVLFSPGIVFDTYLSSRYQVMVFLPLFYCVFSVISTVYITKRYLVQLASMSSGLDETVLGELFEDARISAREREIIMWMSRGLGNKDIGEKLFISENTVKTHIRNIFRKMSVKSRFELIMKLQDDPLRKRQPNVW